MKRISGIFAVMIGGGALAFAAPSAAPTFQELMDPAWFPNPQCGLAVESVSVGADSVRVRTTGAEIALQLATGDIQFNQRIDHPRPLAVLHLGRALEGIRVTHSGPGLAWISFERPALAVRVNGDSLFMLHVKEPLSAGVQMMIDTAWNASFQSSHLIADEWGGLFLGCSMGDVDDKYDPYACPVATYPLAADAVLWVGVCPPKPYDWTRSISDNVVWHWSNTLAYPDNATLKSWQSHGNIVLLQSEVMLWKDWNLDFVPRLGVNEFERVRRMMHSLRMRFIVYTSPYYFLRGTALESKALNSFEGFTNWPPGTPTGENMGLFLDAIRRVMSECRPDGLYFDGQYTENPAALYALARSAREIVGEEGLLEWHSTVALGSGNCYLPQADAYVDFILRGEGQEKRYTDEEYLRFFVSGYNINNCVGVLCNNGANVPTPELVGRVLAANARLHTIADWIDNPEIMRVLENGYKTRLRPELQAEVEKAFDGRQKLVAEKAAAARAEKAALEAAPGWTKPVFSREFTVLPEVESVLSPVNPTPFSIVEDALQIEARAHTYAFYRFPVEHPATGVVVKLRHGADGGMSWGPAVMLRWPDGSALRIGTRSDGRFQADILGKQLCGGEYAVDAWVWLRARWQQQRGVIERSDDGVQYTRLWTFDHGGRFIAPPGELLVGKVPFTGQPADYSEPGPVGICQIASVQIYAD